MSNDVQSGDKTIYAGDAPEFGFNLNFGDRRTVEKFVREFRDLQRRVDRLEGDLRGGRFRPREEAPTTPATPEQTDGANYDA